MSWLLLATIGQFLAAIVVFLDKHIVSDARVMPKPFVYAFYSCLLTGGWVIIYLLGYIPGISSFGHVPDFGSIERPTIQVMGMSLLAAYTYFMALVSFYDALRRSEAVNVMPIVGSITTLSTLGLGYLFLETDLANNLLYGVLILIVGTALVAQQFPDRYTMLTVVHAGFFFGLHHITMKGLFEETSFEDGFFWSRVGMVFFALSLLMVPTYYKKIREQTAQSESKAKTGLLVFGAKVLAGVSSFLILKATDWGQVEVVQALDALKFVFILVIAVVCSQLLPDTAVKTETRPRVIVQQILYVVLICVGFMILFW